MALQLPLLVAALAWLYVVEGFDQPRSGKAWMEAGLKVELNNFQSKVLKISRQ